MKKILLLGCLIIVSFVNAQDATQSTSDKLVFKKGTQFANANLSLGSSNSNFNSETQNSDLKRFAININTSYSYALSDNFFLGLGLGFSHNDQEEINQLNQTNADLNGNTYRIFPYVRYYKGIGKKIAFFIQGETSFSHSKSKINNENDRTSNNFNVAVRPGLTLMLNKNLALETTIGALGYFIADSKNEANSFESDSKGFNLSLNTSNLLFGLSYYF